MDFLSLQQKYMQICLDLAANGLGSVAPNPLVGCVIVCRGEIIGKGFHEKFGKAHAEVNAINSVVNKELLKDSILYVNLEPCSHFGKTPPCADLIIHHKIKEVVIGSLDSNPLVSGKGIKKLMDAGCNVTIGILEEESKALNKRFFTFQEKKRPYIILKWAQTKDGFISSKLQVEICKLNMENLRVGRDVISNATSHQLVHKWRAEEQAIMVGTNTALLDNPKLTVRGQNGKNPIRVVLDRVLKVPTTHHIYDESAPTIIFTETQMDAIKNIDFVTIDFDNHLINQVLNELYHREIQSVIIEGGQQLLNAFIMENYWDEARVFVADKKFTSGVLAPDIFSNPVTFKQNIDGDELLIFNNVKSH